tara:strand:- start:1356 stop:1532 length:177 start_codon:yes stop_codon:yes gene_type:complete
MNELLIAFLIVSISFVGLSIGLLARNQPIKGSCGGLANLDDGAECQICGKTNSDICNN